MTTNTAPETEHSALDEEDPDLAAAARVKEEEPSSESLTGTEKGEAAPRNAKYDIANDGEAAFLSNLMTGTGDEAQLAKDERALAKDNYYQFVRAYSIRTQFSLEREMGLGAFFTQRYELIWFPQIQHGHLVVDLDAVIEEQDEVHPEELLHSFAEMFDEKTRGYLEGRMRHPKNNRMVPLVDDHGNEVRMKAYYLRHSLVRLSKEERREFRPFQSPFLRPGPQKALQLSYQRMLEAKWTPGERVLGRTLGVALHQLRELPEHKKNANRIFYTALVERDRRLQIQNTKSAVPFHMAFGLTPHMIPDFSNEDRAVLHSHPRAGMCPAGLVAVMAAPSMAAIQSNIEFAHADMQTLMEGKLCKLQFLKDPKNRVAKFSA